MCAQIYPLTWEIPIDDVFFNGQRLPRSALGPPNVSLSALVDTGSSLIRGPRDVVQALLAALGGPTYPCAAPQALAFQIGGKLFPVDPRDFISPNSPGNASTCVAGAVVGTDPPSPGALFSWSLGDPFLKSNLVAFYYGNLTEPSADPPRVGFLSRVPGDAEEELERAVDEAERNGGVFECECCRMLRSLMAYMRAHTATTQAAPTNSSVIVGTASKTHAPGRNGLPGSLSTAAPGDENSAVGVSVGAAAGRACAFVVLSSLFLLLGVL